MLASPSSSPPLTYLVAPIPHRRHGRPLPSLVDDNSDNSTHLILQPPARPPSSHSGFASESSINSGDGGERRADIEPRSKQKSVALRVSWIEKLVVAGLSIAAGTRITALGLAQEAVSHALVEGIVLLVLSCTTFAIYSVVPFTSPRSHTTSTTSSSSSNDGPTLPRPKKRPSYLGKLHMEPVKPTIPEEGPSAKVASHRVWGMSKKCFRLGADDGVLYGSLLAPIVAAGKLVDVINNGSVLGGLTVEYTQSKFELMCLFSILTQIHLLLSKLSFARKMLRSQPRSALRTFAILFTTITVITLLVSILATNLLPASGFLNPFPTLAQMPWWIAATDCLSYQVGLYICAGVLKKSFTFGEMAVVSAGYGLVVTMALETSATKASLLYLPANAFFCAPTSQSTISFGTQVLPDLIGKAFQPPAQNLLYLNQVLILGVLLIGVLLYPLLSHSRYLAQQPIWKKEREGGDNERRWVAAAIFLLTVIIIALILRQWALLVTEVDPFIWTFTFLLQSPTRLYLILYYLSAISLVLLLLATRLPPPSPTTFHPTPMTLSRSLNLRRKIFHFLALFIFTPGYLLDPPFLHLSFSLALSIFFYFEYLRYFAVYPIGKPLHVFFASFLDSRDVGPVILSHVYLLAGCGAVGVWVGCERSLVALSGVIALGMGDSMASIVGKYVGRVKWPGSGKTFEGTVAFVVSTLVVSVVVARGDTVNWNRWCCLVGMTGVLEAVSKQNDNVIVPLVLFAGGCLAGV